MRFEYFWFSARISKTNLKFEKAFYWFVELVETNPLIYNIEDDLE